MNNAHQKRRTQQHLVGATVWWLAEMHPTHGAVLSVSHHGPHGYWYRVEGESCSISGARVYASPEELAQDLLCSTQQMAAAKAYYESPHINRLQLPTFEPPYVYRVSIVEVYRGDAADITRELGYYCTFDAALHVVQSAQHGDPMQHSQHRQIQRYQLGTIQEPEIIWSQGWEHRGTAWIASRITSTVPLYAASETLEKLGFEAHNSDQATANLRL